MILRNSLAMPTEVVLKCGAAARPASAKLPMGGAKPRQQYAMAAEGRRYIKEDSYES